MSLLPLPLALALGLGAHPSPDPVSIGDVTEAVPEVAIRFRVRTKHAKGPVRCGLYAEKKDWLTKRYVFKDTARVHGRVAVCIFRGVPPGRYAISAYHDKNDDGSLDRNFIGIPTEDFTFSSGAKAGLGPPSFEDADFEYPGGDLELTGRM